MLNFANVCLTFVSSSILQAATDPNPAPAVRWFIIALKFSQQSARHFFTRPQFRPTRNVGEWEQSRATAERLQPQPSCFLALSRHDHGQRAAGSRKKLVGII